MGLMSHRGAVLAREVGAPVRLHQDKGLGLHISFPWEGQGGHAGALPSLEDCLGFRWSLCHAELPLSWLPCLARGAEQCGSERQVVS